MPLPDIDSNLSPMALHLAHWPAGRVRRRSPEAVGPVTIDCLREFARWPLDMVLDAVCELLLVCDCDVQDNALDIAEALGVEVIIHPIEEEFVSFELRDSGQRGRWFADPMCQLPQAVAAWRERCGGEHDYYVASE